MSAPCIYITGLCRCCHARGNYKSLGVPYVFEHTEEIYAVLMRDTFDILISPALGENSASTYTICESCITSLQDAARFKQQVLCCEEKFNKILLEELQVKIENEDDLKNEYSEDNWSVSSNLKPDDTTELGEVEQGTVLQPKKKKRLLRSSQGKEVTIPPDKTIGRKPYICHVCGKSFTRIDIFKDHMALHSSEQPFKCKFCPKRFFVQQNRKTHERQHIEAKKFICEICKKAFHLKRSLKTHMLSHTGEKPFACGTCHKSFQLKGTLKLHMRTHTGEKPFCCEICKKAFRQKQSLRGHMRVHTGVKVTCEICHMTLASKNSLRVHMRRHTGEKDTCKVCSKQVSNLYDHMKVHKRAMEKCT